MTVYGQVFVIRYILASLTANLVSCFTLKRQVQMLWFDPGSCSGMSENTLIPLCLHNLDGRAVTPCNCIRFVFSKELICGSWVA